MNSDNFWKFINFDHRIEVLFHYFKVTLLNSHTYHSKVFYKITIISFFIYYIDIFIYYFVINHPNTGILYTIEIKFFIEFKSILPVVADVFPDFYFIKAILFMFTLYTILFNLIFLALDFLKDFFSIYLRPFMNFKNSRVKSIVCKLNG